MTLRDILDIELPDEVAKEIKKKSDELDPLAQAVGEACKAFHNDLLKAARDAKQHPPLVVAAALASLIQSAPLFKDAFEYMDKFDLLEED